MIDLQELKTEWPEYNRKLDEALTLNKLLLSKIQRQEARRSLRPLWTIRLWETNIWLVIIVALAVCIGAFWGHAAPTISAGVLLLFSLAGLIGAIGQLVLLRQLDYGAPILALQKKLERIRMHQLWFERLLLAMLPLYMAHVFFWTYLFFGIDLYQFGDQDWLQANIILTLILIPFTAWLLREMGKVHPRFRWIAALRRNLSHWQIEHALAKLDYLRKWEQQAH